MTYNEAAALSPAPPLRRRAPSGGGDVGRVNDVAPPMSCVEGAELSILSTCRCVGAASASDTSLLLLLGGTTVAFVGTCAVCEFAPYVAARVLRYLFEKYG